MEPLVHRLTVNIPTSLVAALDAEAARRSTAAPGVRYTRADAVRALLLGALPTPALPTAGSCR